MPCAPAPPNAQARRAGCSGSPGDDFQHLLKQTKRDLDELKHRLQAAKAEHTVPPSPARPQPGGA